MYCECGCGKITPIAKQTNTKKGWVKGQHTKCCYGHSPIKHLAHYQGRDVWIAENQNKHLCACGCGEYIVIKKHHKSQGIPRYILGHYVRTDKMKDIIRKTCVERVGKLSPRWKEDRNSVRGRKRAQVEFTKRMKRAIYTRDEGKCQSCGAFTLLEVSVHDPLKTNIDHIIPVQNGGDNSTENGQVLCLICHKLKHSAKAKRVNSGKPRTGNPEPSRVETRKVQRLLEDSTLSLITSTSALPEREEIV